MNASRYRILFAFLLCSAAIGCGPTIRRSTELKENKLQTIAVLPTIVDSDIRRERVEYIRESIISQLETSGYVVLDSAYVDRVCKDATCPDRAKLAERHGVDALLELRLKSVDRANFVAGYYNTITGDVRLLDPRTSKELFAIEHTEREKGGLLFNSGQVIQGLVQTVENAGDDSFNRLAERFGKSIALKMPTPQGGVGKVTDVNLASAEIVPLGSSRFQICATGTPGGTATLVIDRVRTPLREGARGEYCGVYLVDGLVRPDSRVSVELRSPYGVVTQTSMQSSPLLACAPKDFVRTGSGSTGIALSCDGDADGEKKALCEKQLALCKQSELIVYKSSNPFGPYQRIAGSGSQLLSTQKKSEPNTIFAVVAKSKNGALSVPVTLEETQQ